MILETITDKFDYKKLTPEEQKSKGILGRLTGVIADFKNPTRNGRLYSESLWDRVFSNDIMKEKIQNRCVFGELGHPTDREETDMEKIALCLAEQPKRGKDGKLYGVFDILDTPNGRILKTLCDYGCNIGISSRGSGDVVTDYDGNESVDPNTYDCQGWDAVLIPAVKEARLQYVTESLNKKKYNKTLRDKLQESLNGANEADKKVIKESLDTFGISLNEDDLHQVFRKDAKDQYKSYSQRKDAYDKKANSVQQDLKDLGETDPERIDKFTKHIVGEEPVFKYEKGHNKLERQNYPFYVTVYEGTSYYHPEEGGYYEAGLEPYYSEGYQTFEEAQQALQKYLEENSSTTVAFNPGNIPSDDDNYSYSESEEEYKPIYDSKNRLIGAIASGKYIGEEEQVWVESNKQYLGKQSGYHPYESLSENKLKSEILDESVVSNARDWLVDKEGKTPQEAADIINKSTPEEIVKIALQWINNKQSSAVDSNEAVVEELQNTLKQKQELETKLAKLQEELSVGNAKEVKLNEEISRYKSTIIKLTENVTRVKALNEKIEVINKEKTSLENQLNSKSDECKKLLEEKKSLEENQKKLNESFSGKESKANALLETLRKDNQALKSENKTLEKEFESLNESVENIKTDFELNTKRITEKLEQSDKQVKKYQKIANMAVDRYITEKANHIGASVNEIKNRLPESYTFTDIDNICEDLKAVKLNFSKLPFNLSLNEGKNLKVQMTPVKDTIIPNSEWDDEVDDQLLRLAKLK